MAGEQTSGLGLSQYLPTHTLHLHVAQAEKPAIIAGTLALIDETVGLEHKKPSQQQQRLGSSGGQRIYMAKQAGARNGAPTYRL
jgi:hypothetical protein